jgi:hypothetical protein
MIILLIPYQLNACDLLEECAALVFAYDHCNGLFERPNEVAKQ